MLLLELDILVSLSYTLRKTHTKASSSKPFDSIIKSHNFPLSEHTASALPSSYSQSPYSKHRHDLQSSILSPLASHSNPPVPRFCFACRGATPRRLEARHTLLKAKKTSIRQVSQDQITVKNYGETNAAGSGYVSWLLLRARKVVSFGTSVFAHHQLLLLPLPLPQVQPLSYVWE